LRIAHAQQQRKHRARRIKPRPADLQMTAVELRDFAIAPSRQRRRTLVAGQLDAEFHITADGQRRILGIAEVPDGGSVFERRVCGKGRCCRGTRQNDDLYCFHRLNHSKKSQPALTGTYSLRRPLSASAQT
jgi:hypothetical protein